MLFKKLNLKLIIAFSAFFGLANLSDILTNSNIFTKNIILLNCIYARHKIIAMFIK